MVSEVVYVVYVCVQNVDNKLYVVCTWYVCILYVICV